MFAIGMALASILGGCSGEVSDRDLQTIELAEARRLYASQSTRFVDPRPAEEFAKGHIKGALNVKPVQVTEVKTDMEPSIARAKTVVVYGDNPGTGIARVIAKRLMVAGHKGVRLYAGGLEEWRANGLPVEGSPPKEQ